MLALRVSDPKPRGSYPLVLHLNYLLTQRQMLGTLKDDLVLIKTNASTDLADFIALDYGIKVDNVLTGFKFIAERIQEIQESGEGEFLLGFEESYGYLAGDFVRDKDAVIAAVLVCEAALYFKQQGKQSLLQVLDEIYSRYGYFLEDQASITLEGKEGKEKMEKIILPVSNVIRYSFVGGGFVMVRPSGTEPKIKFYFSVKDQTKEDCLKTLNHVKQSFMNLIGEFWDCAPA